MNGCLYDLAISFAEKRIVGPLRHELLQELRGEIVDVGAGTGANFRHFATDAHVLALEPDSSMARRARARISGSKARIDLRIADDRELEALESRTVDTVVFTLILCTVVDPQATLARAKRVLRPGGTLAVIEHVRSPGCVGHLQDFITPVWRTIGDGCHLNRETADALADAGFDTRALRKRQLPKFSPIQEIIYGATPVL